MILHLTLALVVGQYTRSRVDDSDPNSQCLWWLEKTNITIRQHVDGNPENAGDSEFRAVGAAVTTWATQMATCSSLSMTEAQTRSRKVGYFEDETNENITLFRLRKCEDVAPATSNCRAGGSCGNDFDCWEHQSAAIAITTTSYSPSTGRILDSDIEFNTPSFVFTTVDLPPCLTGQANQNCVATDIQNTATHELGHVLGLAHTSIANSTMNPRAVSGETSKRTLDDGSKRFICEVYPRGLGSKTCRIEKADDDLGKAIGCSTGGGALAVLGLLLVRRRKSSR